MNFLTPQEGMALLISFGVVIIASVWFRTHQEHHAEGFLVADRKVGVWQGAFSIAVSWVWAPAIFICSMQAYNLGLPGIFWFTFPNILCFFVFAPVALRLRKLMPNGYTLPEFIALRFKGNKSTHLAFLAIFFGYQLGAIIINALAGGTLLAAVSGLNIDTAIIGMSLIALAYSLISGMKASVFTDVIQMLMILGLGVLLVPWVISESGGIGTVLNGLGGVTGEYNSLFDPWIAFTMGIPMTISLIAGPIGDQQFFQRAMSVKRENVLKVFIYGGLLFGLVPIILSLLGFVGADLVQQGMINVEDPQIVGVYVIAHLLPKIALSAFVLMAFAGLCSTMDSAFCAVSSLGGIDIYKKYLVPESKDKRILVASRLFMIAIAIAGTAIALLKPKLLWVFLIYGAMAAAGLFPTILALYWKKLGARTACWAVLLSLLIGTPLSIYANVHENPYLIVLASVLSVSVGLVICLIGGVLNKNPFNFSQLGRR